LTLFIGLLAPFARATTLSNQAGPFIAASFGSNWISIWGNTYNPIVSSGDTVHYTASYVKVGNPTGSQYLYTAKITVYDLTTSLLYSTTAAQLGGNYGISVSIPSGHAYNITMWIENPQSSGASYWEVSLTNVSVTNP